MHRFLFLVLSFNLFFELLSAKEQPNIVFILSDNQSYYEMSCHGHAQIQTPHIDRLAKQSVDFHNFHAPPFCSPSRTVILTGRYAMRSGVYTTISGRSIMHARETTLADILQENGYRTAVFGKWHLGFSYPHRPEDRGFDEVFIHGGGGVGQMEDFYGNSLFDTTFIQNGKVAPSKGYCTDTLFDRAMEFVEEQKCKPFFCFVSTPVTHAPHHGPKELVAELREKGVEGNLELFAQVQNLDANIGRMMDKLEELNLSKNTILVYASDQGMNDRGAPHGDNRLGLGFDPAHHVPFMVRAPGVKPAVSKRLAGMIDFFPTVLDFCGIEQPDNIDGMSIRPLLTDGKGYPEDRTLVIQCPRGRSPSKWKNAAVKTDRWRLVEGTKLYDAKVDPRQKNNIASEHPGVVKELTKVYQDYWADIPSPESTLSRHLLGAPECPKVVLNAMDWYKGSSPWNAGAFRGRGGNGAWAVKVAERGTYVFECRFFPREAKKPAGATTAKIQIGETIQVADLNPQSEFARFELDLKPGDYDLQTWLTRGGKQQGSLFVYVSKK